MSGFEDQGLLHAGSPEEPGSPANSPQRPRVKKGIVKDNEMLPGDDSPQRPSKYKPEDYAQAVQEKIEEAVDLQAKYRHAGLYTLFVIAYLLVLYLQASAYKSGEVVRTLKQVMMPKDEDGNLLASTTFKDQHAVLGHLWHNILEPTWKDPVCGDQKCEYPWEFPAYGRFGCRADCGQHQNLTKVLVLIQHDFTGHPTANPRVLMSAAKWNLCHNDPARRARGEADLCWYEEANSFETVKGNVLETAQVIDGTWYVQVTGDYAGRISGAIYDLRNTSDPKPLNVTPAWEKCEIPTVTRRSTLETSGIVRRMMNEWQEKRADRRRRLGEGEITQAEVDEADREMIINLQGRVDQMKEQAQKLEQMEQKIKGMVARMRNKTPAQKRLEKRYHVEPSPRNAEGGYNAEMQRLATMSPEEVRERAKAVKVQAGVVVA